MKDIVKFGKDLSDWFHQNEISLEQFKQELIKAQSDLTSNDYEVICCYFETEIEPTLIIREQELRTRIVDFLGDGGRISSIAYYQDLKNSKSLDEYFKTDRFSKLVVNVWKEIFTEKWEVLEKTFIEQSEKLTFMKPFYNELFEK